MKPGRLRSFVMSAALVIALPAAFAQTTDPGAKQEPEGRRIPNQAHSATALGDGISEGTKTAAHKTESGTEKGYDKKQVWHEDGLPQDGTWIRPTTKPRPA